MVARPPLRLTWMLIRSGAFGFCFGMRIARMPWSKLAVALSDRHSTGSITWAVFDARHLLVEVVALFDRGVGPDREQALRRADLDVLGLHARERRFDHHIRLRLVDVDRHHLAAAARVVRLAGGLEQLLQQVARRVGLQKAPADHLPTLRF